MADGGWLDGESRTSTHKSTTNRTLNKRMRGARHAHAHIITLVCGVQLFALGPHNTMDPIIQVYK